MKNLRAPLQALWLAASLVMLACAQPEAKEIAAPESSHPSKEDSVSDKTTDQTEVATLGAGCFWCTEAVLEQVDGIIDVSSGYMGGHVEDPTYEQICGKQTGHVEVVQVTFDPKVLPYEHVLAWFWNLHDPTTLNQQGNDVGPQYRSAIFYHSAEQRDAATRSMAEAASKFDDPIVTEITEASTYWSAEAYHQDYYRQNKAQGYCRYIIAPKLDKLGLEK